MYRNGSKNGLSQAQLEAARLGFNQYLRRKRFSPQFISRHAEDLFAQATLEYSRKLAEGSEIENPPGWLIECAWRRTKSQLEAEARGPRVVSTEKSGPVVDERGESPEDVLLDEDRFHRLREAVGELSVTQRRILAHSYFEGLTVREAARHLHWHSSKAQRAHEGAKKRLYELLGVESLDDLAIEIGLAAYLSLAVDRPTGLTLPPGIEGAVEMVGRGASSAWARAQELARRLPMGSGAEPSTTAALGSAGRAAGVCATAALACLASGVVGPGVGGVNLLGGDHGKPPAKSQRAVAAARHPSVVPRNRPVSPIATRPEKRLATPHVTREASASTSTKRANRAVSSQTIESAATSQEVSSAPTEPAPVESSAPSTSSSSSATQVASEQFGP
jgi:RNA polymerase sigma factor (sigma-70 family)